MKTIYKAYKFRMYPDLETKTKLNQFLGIKRFIYNYYLNKKDEIYKEESRNYTIKEMKQDILKLYIEYPWLKEVDSTIIRTSIIDLDNAYTRYFKKLSNHPKYKSKNYKQSYKTNCIRSSYKNNNYSNIKVDLSKYIIKLPKLNPIKIKGYRKLKTFENKIISATISKEVVKILKDNLNTKLFSEDSFNKWKTTTIIDKMLTYENEKNITSDFVDNIFSYDLYKNDTIDFIKSLNYNECIEYINKLDFSNNSILINEI